MATTAALIDEYFDVLEGFPQDVQRTVTRLKEVDAVSHRLLADVTTKTRALTDHLLVLPPEDRDARLADLREEYAKLLGFVEEKVATVQRALPAATTTANRLEELLLQLEDALVEPLSGDEAEDATAAVGAGAGYGAGITATRYQPAGAPAGQKHRVPGKAATAAAAAPPTAPVAAATAAVAAGAAKGASASGPGASAPSALTGKRRADGTPGPAATAASPPKKKQRQNPLAALENLPIYKGKNPCPPLCGPNAAAPDYILQRGDTVAARTSKKGDQQEWILATVVRYYAGRQRYEVEDIDDGEDEEKQPGTRKKYTLPADAIIPMPKSLPDPSKGLEFPAGKTVLALYPGTTCFYEAQVIQPPSKRKKENDYLLQFVDDEESGQPQKAVGQAFVLNFPGH